MKMKEMVTKFIGITGSKKSGKTTTIEYLTPKLIEKGLNVGSVKIAFKDVNIDVNKEHYDVERLRNAKSVKTLFKSRIDTTIFYNKVMTLREALKEFSKGLDLVLIEGFQEDLIGFPQIAMLKEKNQEKEIINDYTVAISSIPEFSIESKKDNFVNFNKLVDIIEKKALPLIPSLDCKHCGYENCITLVKEIIKGNNKIEDCIIVQSEKAHLVLQLNEKNIPCNPFVQEVLKNTILGIIKTLKIEEKEISEIDIKILVNSKETKEIFHE